MPAIRCADSLDGWSFLVSALHFAESFVKRAFSALIWSWCLQRASISSSTCCCFATFSSFWLSSCSCGFQTNNTIITDYFPHTTSHKLTAQATLLRSEVVEEQNRTSCGRKCKTNAELLHCSWSWGNPNVVTDPANLKPMPVIVKGFATLITCSTDVPSCEKERTCERSVQSCSSGPQSEAVWVVCTFHGHVTLNSRKKNAIFLETFRLQNI